jgi:release factor glutamine methyltransferase
MMHSPLSPPPPFDTELVDRLRRAGCVFAEDEARLLQTSARSREELDRLASRRVAGEPLEHILGWAEFAGIRVAVDPGVFVPRRRTEFLVRLAAALTRPGVVVVDLCCGSGAVGLALCARTPGIDLYASDIDPVAVRCAARNLESTTARVLQGDLFAALPSALAGRVDLIVANAPYVPTDAIARMPAEARVHESRIALDGGADGVDVHRRIAAEAPRWLGPGGSVLVETSDRQAAVTAALFAEAGLDSRIHSTATATVVSATRASAAA